MTRTVPEWVATHDDQAIPPRVRLRVWEKASGHCASCTRKIVAEKWECDHKRALVLGGKHAESNLQVLCVWCHKRKTKDDVAIKSYNSRRRLAHAGIKRRKSRPIIGSRDSGWKISFSRGAVRR